jgi:hypothetical protein
MRSGVKGAKPSLKHVYAAVETGHIDDEQAADLNPVYNPKKKIRKNRI